MQPKSIPILGIALVMTFYGCATSERPDKTPPDPALVKVAWDPPKTTIDPRYVKTAKALLGNGLADPRGGKFCQVTLKPLPNSTWIHLDTRNGWVLPNAKSVVFADGLEYPVTVVGQPANLDDSVKGNGFGLFGGFGGSGSALAAPAVLLLAGRPDLAETMFQRYAGIEGKDPSFALTDSLFRQIYSQAAQALSAKQDAQGLSWARRLLTVAEVESSEHIPVPDLVREPFAFSRLDFARNLYQDMVRRTSSATPSSSESSKPDITEEQWRVDKMIKRLADVSIQPVGRWQSVDYSQDPTYLAIRGQGQKAVPELIEALAHDRRFTRTVTSEDRMFVPTYTMHPVSEVIFDLLMKVWPSSRLWVTKDQVSMADGLRKAWPADTKLTVPEQWVEVLASDKVTPTDWLTACQYLVTSSDVLHPGAWVQTKPIAAAQMNGAPLFAKRGAEISSLIAKRAIQMAKTQKGEANDLHTCADALFVGDCLSKWSPKTSTAALAELTHIVRDTILKWTAGHPEYGLTCADPFSRVITDRIRNGDRSAVADFGQVVMTFAPNTWITPRELEPFWLLLHDPVMHAITERYLSEMGKKLASPEKGVATKVDLFLADTALVSPMLAMSAFRRMLVTGCENEANVGEAWAEKQGANESLNYSLTDGSGGNRTNGVDPNQPLGTKIAISNGDYLAQLISEIKGAPRYCMIWPTQQRKGAKAALIKWLSDDKLDWLKIAKGSPQYTAIE